MVQFLLSSCDSNSLICISTYSRLVQVLTFDLLEASLGAPPLHGVGEQFGISLPIFLWR